MKKLLFLIMPLLLLASVSIKVNKKVLNKGDELIITLTATGKNIHFPNPSEIAGYKVIGTSLVSNIEIINGVMNESLSKSFIIIPTKSFTIPPFKIVVDGKTYTTKPIKIEVKTPQQTKGDYTIDINVSKKTLYLGESAILNVKIRFKPPIESIQLQKPSLNGFVIQEISKDISTDTAVYKFLITPLKAGKFKIGPLVASIGILVKENPFNDPFFNLSVSSLKFKTIYSNQVEIDVKPIPQNSVFGDFNMTMKAKNIVNANEPNEAVLTITGCGDFHDLPDYKLNIPNTTIYAHKPQIKVTIKNNQICGTYIKKFTILSDHDYEIPSLKLNEFNSTLKTISTKPIKVKVIGAKAPAVKHPSQITKTSLTTEKPKEKPKNYFDYLIYALILITGMAIGYFISLKRAPKESNIITKIKKANQKELFNLLIPYSNDQRIKEILKQLEENIYKGAKHKINKKEIIKIIKELNSD